MDKIAEIKRIAAELQALYPGVHLQLSICNGEIDFTYHGSKTYSDATAFFRELHVQQREKQVYSTYTALKGEYDGVKVTTFPDELPPTCRKVTKIERIPKTKVVETGEFIEVPREVIECGPEPELAAQTQQPA